MKDILFIPLIKKENLNKNTFDLSKLPKQVYLAYTIQFKKIAEQVRMLLMKNKISIAGFSQVLGCTPLKSTSPILLISEASFNANNLLEKGNKVWLFNNHTLIKLKPLKQANKLNKFYHANTIGILVSTKQGQYNKEAIKLKKTLKKPSYLFLADNINLAELENFNIDFWVNTACPRLAGDCNKIINYKKINKK